MDFFALNEFLLPSQSFNCEPKVAKIVKRILSYNVNGIRSAVRKGLLEFIQDISPYIVCIQEIKAQHGQMHEEDFLALGYQIFAFPAQKAGYSGVAILSKGAPDRVVYGMNNVRYDREGRVIQLDFGDISVISAYFPSGTTGDVRQAFKMEFLEDFQLYLRELRKTRPNLIVSGDFNICRLWIDIHNPEKQQNTSGFLPEEREWFSQFVAEGYVDSFREISQEPHQYSWWSYRAGARQNNKGWRIDYHIVSESIRDRIVDAKILPQAQHSDHCPVLLDIEF
jgi:exodeoxyribonuclease-3